MAREVFGGAVKGQGWAWVALEMSGSGTVKGVTGEGLGGSWVGWLEYKFTRLELDVRTFF